ncbi:MAG: alpha/beta fold hydrolase [Candidatus Dormibacteria bacterium]
MELKSTSLHGHRIAYYEAGSGPTLVLVHGIGGSGRTWKRVIPRLAERFHVVAPDLMGHGASERLRGDYSLGAHASTVRDLMVKLGVERATIVGHSLGGGIAMVFAYQFPDRCERLVLVSSGGLGSEVSILLRLLSLPGSEWVVPLGTAPWLTGAVSRVGGVLGRVGFRLSPVADEIWQAYTSLGSTSARLAFLATVREVVDIQGQRVSANDRLYLASQVPVLIVWGSRDNIIPVAHGRAAHSEIPGSRLEVFEGVGHFAHSEEPERFTRLLEDFLRTTKPSHVTAEAWRKILAGGQTPTGRPRSPRVRTAGARAASRSATPKGYPTRSRNAPT